MSVEPCLIRVTTGELDRLRDDPAGLTAFIEDGYESGAFTYDWSPQQPLGRMLHLDEFGMWLLTGFDDDTPLCRALVGWDAPMLEGASHGHGGVRYRDPAHVSLIARELSSVSGDILRERFDSRKDDYRAAAAGFLDGDEAILAHQQAHFMRLRRLYDDAAKTGDCVLLMMV